MKRRDWILKTSATASAVMAANWAISQEVKPSSTRSTARAASATAVEPVLKVADKLRLLIPANAGGGWDTTGRMIGASLKASGAVDDVEYENVGGKGGVVGLQRYVERYSRDPNTLLVGGMVMLGSVALNKPAADMSRVLPIAKLTSEYTVAVVQSDSAFKTAADLSKALREDASSVAIYGGSLGGVDHLFAGLLIRTAGGDPKRMNYSSFSSGKDDVAGVLASGKAKVVLTGYADVRELIKSDRYRVLGISSKNAQYGVKSFREQAIQAEMTNWRGLFTGGEVSQSRVVELTQAVRGATSHPSWSSEVRQNNLLSTLVTGSNFSSVVENDVIISRVMVHLLGLKA
jgi:putative tricarboxylic transport membrane protein